jgi:methylenetetrahydrofolate reductase (NADPH)
LTFQQHDDAAVKTYGVELSVKMMRQLFENGIRGFHLCTLNLEKSVTRVLEALKWVEPAETRVRTSRQRVSLLMEAFVSSLKCLSD